MVMAMVMVIFIRIVHPFNFVLFFLRGNVLHFLHLHPPPPPLAPAYSIRGTRHSSGGGWKPRGTKGQSQCLANTVALTTLDILMPLLSQILSFALLCEFIGNGKREGSCNGDFSCGMRRGNGVRLAARVLPTLFMCDTVDATDTRSSAAAAAVLPVLRTIKLLKLLYFAHFAYSCALSTAIDNGAITS